MSASNITPLGQKGALAWCAAKGYPTTPEARALKLAEEAGEVIGAVVKIPEGRKTKADLAQEIGQLTICALALCEASGIDFWDALTDEWMRCHGSKPTMPKGAK